MVFGFCERFIDNFIDKGKHFSYHKTPIYPSPKPPSRHLYGGHPKHWRGGFFRRMRRSVGVRVIQLLRRAGFRVAGIRVWVATVWSRFLGGERGAQGTEILHRLGAMVLRPFHFRYSKKMWALTG